MGEMNDTNIWINNVEYIFYGVITATYGSGDSAETMSIKVFRNLEGVEHWVIEDKGKWWVYRAVADAKLKLKIAKTHENFGPATPEVPDMPCNLILPPETDLEVYSVSPSRSIPQVGPWLFRWVTLATPFPQAPQPFTDTDQVLIVNANNQQYGLMSCAMTPTGSNEFYSFGFPSKDMTKEQAYPSSSPMGVGSYKFETMLLVGLILVFAVAVFYQSSLAIATFWIGAPLLALARQILPCSVFQKRILQTLCGVFFFHFTTHAIDNFATQTMADSAEPSFQCARLAVTCLAFLVLHLATPAFYQAIIHASYRYGGYWWSAYTITVFFLADGEVIDASLLSYSYYAGSPWWGIPVMLILIFAIIRVYRDYRKAPTTLQGFQHSLSLVSRSLQLGLATIIAKGPEIERLLNDLSDATAISTNPNITSLETLGSRFQATSVSFKNLADLLASGASDDMQKLLEADFTTLAEDYIELSQNLSQLQKGERPSVLLPRLSPTLATWND